MRRPSIRDVAKLAGVSVATVSHTINKTHFVSDEAQEKVKAAIQELGYQPNAAARSFRTGKKNMIGFIIPDISNNFFATLIEEVESAVSVENYHLIIANTKETVEREREHIRYLSSGIVDGLLIASTMRDVSDLEGLLPPGFPVVFIDRKLPGLDYDIVYVTSHNAIYQGVQNLIQQGHRRIGFISSVHHVSTTQERQNAYRAAMRDYGIDIEDNFIQYCSAMQKSAPLCLDELTKAKCSAIVISNGLMVSDVLQYFNNNGIVVGKSISLLSFVDYSSIIFNTVQMDIVEQPGVELGRLGGQRILQRIQSPQAPTKEIILNSTYHQCRNATINL